MSSASSRSGGRSSAAGTTSPLIKLRLSGPVWSNRDFLKLWGGQTVSRLGDSISFLALPTVAVLQLHAGPFEVGLIAALQRVAFPVLGLLAGVWVDRLPRRRVMIVADLGRFLVYASIPVASVLGVLRLEQLYVVALLVGTLQLFFDVAYLAYVPALVDRENLADANTKLQVSDSVSWIAGPALAGFLIQLIGAARAVAIDSASFLVSALSVLAIRRSEPSHRGVEGSSVRAELLDGLRTVFGNPILRSQILIIAFAVMGAHLVDGVLFPWAYDDLRLTPGEVGAAFSIAALGGIAGSLGARAMQRRLGIGLTLSLTMCGFPLGVLALPTLVRLHPLGGLTVGLALAFTLDTIMNITQVTLRQSVTSHRYQGRMNAAFRTVVWGMITVGSFIGGALGARVGAVPTLYTAAAIGLLGGAAIFLSPIGRLGEFPRAID